MKAYRRVIILAIAACCTLGVHAQHYVGVRGGYGGGTIRFEPARETGFLIGMPSGGVSWKYYSEVKYVGAIGIDLQYIEKGFKWFPRVGSDTSYQRRMQTIEMPFMWQPHLYLFKHHVRTFINLGVYASYIISSDSSTVSRKNGVLHSGNYPMRLVKDNAWGYGLCAGAGIGVLLDRFEILVEARYSFGYSDLLKNSTKYPGNPARSPNDALNFSMGIYYRLGKGGIIAPQGKAKTGAIP